MKVKLPIFKCKRCGHEWNPRKPDVRQCPKCKSAYWDQDKEVKEVNEKEVK